MSAIIRRAALGGAVACLLVTLMSAPAAAQVVETRESSANPMVEVFKSTVYGGLAGLLLGSALALAVESDEGDVVKWGFVGGTFFGFGYGIYHVSHRPQPGQALLERRGGEWALAHPSVTLSRTTATAGWAPPTPEETTFHATVASVRF